MIVRNSLRPSILRRLTFLVLPVYLIAVAIGTSAVSIAQTSLPYSNYIWDRDPSSGTDIALSRNGQPVNFLVVGNLASHSVFFVEKIFGLVADAAGIKVDRDMKGYALL